MKSKNFKDVFFYVLIFAAWFLSGLRKVLCIETAILFIAFVASSAVYLFVKDIKIKSIAMILITVGAGIYTYEYAVFYVPVLLLLIMCDCARKKKEEKAYDTCSTVFVALILFKAAYTVFIRVDAGRYLNGNITTYFKASAFIIVFLALMLLTCIRENKTNKKKYSKIFNVYVFSIIGIFQDTLLLAVKNINGEIQSALYDFMAWFVLMLFMAYLNNNEGQVLFDKINGRLKNFLDITG